MRIGIDAHMLGDHSGGNESYYTNILKNMSVSADDEVYLFVKPGIKRENYMDKFNVVEFEDFRPFKRNFIELPNLCRRYNLDLLHTQYFIPLNRPCPVVCTIHDICFEHYRSIFTWKEYLRQKLLIPYSARHSVAIITDSAYSKMDISSCYKISDDKIVVAFGAVGDDFRRLSPDELDSKELRQKFGINGDFILNVGNLQPRKNLVRLIKAYSLLKKSGKINEQLVIVGKKAWMYNDILVEALNDVGNDIVFTDYVSESDLIRLYNDAELFVYPSFFEGFGIPPLESMACGTPVAVSNVTSIPEVVGNAGIYFNPFDIDEIAESILTLRDLVQKDSIDSELISSQVRRFDWKRSADVIYQSYKNQCAERAIQ